MRTRFWLLHSIAIGVAAETVEERVFRELLPLAKAQGIDTDQSSTSYRIAPGELQKVQAQAMLSSSGANFILGMLYLFGLPPTDEQLSQRRTRNEEIGMKHLLLAANEDHVDAQCAIGILLTHGLRTIGEDRAAAKSFFRSASDRDHPPGRWLLGRALLQETAAPGDDTGSGMAEAAGLFRSVAEEIPVAAHQLAVMYEYGLVPGEGTAERSFRKAAELYERASRRGLVESTYHLALMHAHGRGVPQDYAAAAELFESAATSHRQPHAPSMRYLAVMYANGYSRSRIPDYERSLEWYEACAAAKEDFSGVRQRCAAERKSLLDVINDSTQNRIP